MNRRELWHSDRPINVSQLITLLEDAIEQGLLGATQVVMTGDSTGCGHAFLIELDADGDLVIW